MKSLLRTFRKLSRWTWHANDVAHKLPSPLSETTITQMLLIDLKYFHRREIVVRDFTQNEEATTGADWEWWFVERGLAFGMRIQAKLLEPSALQYRGLVKKVGQDKAELQVDVLIRNALHPCAATGKPMFPAYCFYNYWSNAEADPTWPCTRCRKKRELYGCAVAGAARIRPLIHNGKTCLKDIGPFLLPWCRLVCGRTFESRNPSLPERARESCSKMAIVEQELPKVAETPAYVVDLASAESETEAAVVAQERRLGIAGILIIDIRR